MRFPRKKKKLMKKAKAKADALIMAQTAITAAISAVQLAMINAQPIRYPHDKTAKALAIVNRVTQTANSIHVILNQIQPWQKQSV